MALRTSSKATRRARRRRINQGLRRYYRAFSAGKKWSVRNVSITDYIPKGAAFSKRFAELYD